MNLTLAKAVDRYVGVAVCYALAGLRVLRSVVRRPDSLVEANTILLVKFWGLGNIVLLHPVIRAIRRRFPNARVVFVSLARNREVLDASPDVDRTVYIDDRNVLVLVATLLTATLKCYREKPDLCIDFEQFARTSAILAVLARATQIIGLATPGQGRSILYHKQVRYDDRQHMGQTYLDLARAAGVPERLYRPARVPFGREHEDEVDVVLSGAPDGDAPLVVLHPGSGDNFQGRRWPAESFSALADRLVARCGATVVVTGAPSERGLVFRVREGCDHRDRVLDASGQLSILGLAALVSRAHALVTNDTAPVHLGSSVGTPVFAFFGPNTPRLYGPLSEGSRSFYRALPCSPCLTNMNYKTSLCRMPVCIRDVAVDEVFERICARLSESRGPDASERDGGGTEDGVVALSAGSTDETARTEA